jgi:toxin ParE1/3/4
LTGRVRFTEAAEADIDDAVTWYAAQRPELSIAFLQAVNEVVDRVARSPLGFPMRVDDVRRANLPRRWPYSLWFITEPDGSVVIAALHQRRDPRTVRRRRKLEP